MLPAKQVPVEKDVWRESVEETAKPRGDTSGMEDEMCVNTATLKRVRHEKPRNRTRGRLATARSRLQRHRKEGG
ncbi:hypothetical protein MRX96_009381 [Rhipicephalus microplus]